MKFQDDILTYSLFDENPFLGGFFDKKNNTNYGIKALFLLKSTYENSLFER